MVNRKLAECNKTFICSLQITRVSFHTYPAPTQPGKFDFAALLSLSFIYFASYVVLKASPNELLLLLLLLPPGIADEWQ